MAMSLPLKLNLFSLSFTASLSLLTIGVGGGMLFNQQRENAVARASLAANELVNRAIRLRNLEMQYKDFLEFNTQCKEVIQNDPLLEAAGLFLLSGKLAHSSSTYDYKELSFSDIDETSYVTDQKAKDRWYIIQKIQRIAGETEGYIVISIDNAEFFEAVFNPVFVLALLSFFFATTSLLMQQGIFSRSVGTPLSELVETADSLGGLDPDQIVLLESRASADDIGRIYGSLARLLRRLLETHNKLEKQNHELDSIVRERTTELIQANAKLAEDIERRKSLEEELKRISGTDSLSGLPHKKPEV